MALEKVGDAEYRVISDTEFTHYRTVVDVFKVVKTARVIIDQDTVIARCTTEAKALEISKALNEAHGY
jgi:nitrogen regulatory protein PII-like uncharacterized protein